MTKPTKWLCAQRRQISLGIHPVWSESSLSTWRNLGSLATHWAHSKDSDQTGQMPRLNWVFAGHTVILLVLSWGGSNEPSLEIMARFVLRKLILQLRMCSHPVGLDVWFLVGPSVYFHSSCVRTMKALARLRGCASSPEPSLVAYVISTIISCAGSNKERFHPLLFYSVLVY